MFFETIFEIYNISNKRKYLSGKNRKYFIRLLIKINYDFYNKIILLKIL